MAFHFDAYAALASIQSPSGEAWDERAASREYNGNHHREQAEIGAAAELGLNVIDLRTAADRLRSGHRSVWQRAEGSGYEQAS